MKIEIKNKEYSYITDDSRLVDKETAFLLTQHNQKYKAEVEVNGVKKFLTAKELFKEWNLDEIKIIGVTGTNGKTTTTNIIAHILKKAGYSVAVSGTEGVFLHRVNEIKQIAERTHTTPEILTTLNNLRIAKDEGGDFYVMEVSSHGIFQNRIEGLKFAARVFTNLSQDHLDFHKTMDEYARVKSSFFQDEDSWKIINLDDEWIHYKEQNTLLYSLKNKSADLFAENFNFSSGIEADIFYQGKKESLSSKMIGKFNLYNLLAAIGIVLRLTDLNLKNILDLVSDFSGVEGRMETLLEKDFQRAKLRVFSDYAHTPDAIKKVLTSLDKKNKIITVIGAGGDRDRTKRAPMAELSCKNSDYVFLTSDNPRTENPQQILTDMEERVNNIYKNYSIILDRKEAIKKALDMAEAELKNNNSVLVAILGKGNENYIDIDNQKIPYSDREEIEKYLFDF